MQFPSLDLHFSFPSFSLSLRPLFIYEYMSDEVRRSAQAEDVNGVVERRPDVLECDVVRFQNNKEKWVALVGLLDGHPYEIFTGLADEDEGIMLPKSVNHGHIVKHIDADGTKRYDFQFNPEYWNYAKLISGVLRYRMPIENVVRLVASLQLDGDSVNNWKTGVERALKRYLPDVSCDED